MSVAVSTIDHESTFAALLGGPPAEASPPSPARPSPDLTPAERAVFAAAAGRASVGLFLDSMARGVALTTDQHFEVCGRAGREALRAMRAGRGEAEGVARAGATGVDR